MFELFEPASHNFHLYSRLEHDIRQQSLSFSIRPFTSQKYGIATFHGKNRTTLVF